MRGELLERLMRLVAKTGERHVLVDASLPEPLVILPFTAYEGLVGDPAPRQGPAVVPVRAAEPADTWLPEPSVPAGNPVVTEAEEALNEEEKFYLEPID